MKEINGQIHFSKSELRGTSLESPVRLDDAYDAFLLVDAWRDDVEAQIDSVKVSGMSGALPVADTTGITRLLQRRHRLDMLAEDLGSLVARDLTDEIARGMIDKDLAGLDIPGLDLDNLYEK